MVDDLGMTEFHIVVRLRLHRNEGLMCLLVFQTLTETGLIKLSLAISKFPESRPLL